MSLLSNEIVYTSIAVWLTVIGSFGNALGYVLQKKGHIQHYDENKIRESKDELPKPLISNHTWLKGFIICLIGSILSAVAFKFGAQSVLAPLSALVLVFNAGLAFKILNEPLTRNNTYGIILVIAGSVIAVTFGPKSSGDNITLAYIESCWQNHIFLIFFGTLTLFLFADYCIVRGYEKQNEESMELTQTIKEGANFMMISYISFAAYCGAVNVLFMKSLMIIMASFHFFYFSHYMFYVTVFGIILINVPLEYFRQRAIKYFDAIYVVPIFQVLYILTSTILGAIFFGEFKHLTRQRLMMFIFGIFITVTGVAVLAFGIGTAYKIMIKKIGETMNESFKVFHSPISCQESKEHDSNINQLRNSINNRSFKFPAFYGATSAIANAVSSELKIVIDDALFTPINKMEDDKSWNIANNEHFPDIDHITPSVNSFTTPTVESDVIYPIEVEITKMQKIQSMSQADTATDGMETMMTTNGSNELDSLKEMSPSNFALECSESIPVSV